MAYPQGPPPGGYPQPGHPQPGYGYGGYGPVQQEHPQGTVILVLGICSLVLCQLLGPVAWIMGNKAKAEVDASPGRYSNAGNITAGRVCGIIATVILILAVVGYGLLFAVVIAAESGTS